MSDKIFIQHRFTAVKNGMTVNDAITLPKEEYDAMTPDQIEAEKQRKVDAFIEIMTNRQNAIEEQKKSFEERIVQIDAEIQERQEEKAMLELQLENEVVEGGK